MRTEEANRLKDKMDSLFLNCSKANLIESVVPTNRDRLQVNLIKDTEIIYVVVEDANLVANNGE